MIYLAILPPVLSFQLSAIFIKYSRILKESFYKSTYDMQHFSQLDTLRIQLIHLMTKKKGLTCIELDLINFNALFEHVCNVKMHYIFGFLHFLIHSTQLVNLTRVLVFLARILEQLPTLAVQVSIFFIGRNTSTLRWKLTVEIIGERRQKTVTSWRFQLKPHKDEKMTTYTFLTLIEAGRCASLRI